MIYWVAKYWVNKNIRCKAPMLKSDLCDDAYIVVKRRITVEGNALNNLANKKPVFQNNALFRS